MVKYKRQILHHCYDKAKEHLLLNEKDKARDYFDMGIAFVATKRGEGYEVMYEIEGVTIRLWLERFWIGLEKNNLLL